MHTCAIEHGQQNRGDPSCVTVAHSKLPDELFEEHADRLREGVGEACDDETAHQDRPAPAPIWGLHPTGALVHRHTSHDPLGFGSERKKEDPFWSTCVELTVGAT